MNIFKNFNFGINNSNSITVTADLSPKQQGATSKEKLFLERTLFISHSSKDKDVVSPFVEMLINAGFPRQKILYTSNPALGVPLGKDIHEYLRQKLTEDTFVIFMLSNNWCSSSVCENEMGAAWHGNLRHCNIFLPGFNHCDIKDVASSSELAIRYTDDTSLLRDELGQLKRQLEKHFDLEFIDSAWEKSREQFLAANRC